MSESFFSGNTDSCCMYVNSADRYVSGMLSSSLQEVKRAEGEEQEEDRNRDWWNLMQPSCVESNELRMQRTIRSPLQSAVWSLFPNL